MCSVHIVKISAKVRKGRQKHNNSDVEKKIMKGDRRQATGIRRRAYKNHHITKPSNRHTAIP
jgi:hypothetical protein